MRIIHVVPSYWPAVRYGGPIFSVHGLCRALAKKHEITVLTTDSDGPDRLDVPVGKKVDVDGVSVIYFRVSSFRRIFHASGLAAALPEVLRNTHLLHTHSVFLWPTTAAARAAVKRRLPYVVSPRGMLVKDLIAKRSKWTKKIWLNLVERKNIDAASAIHYTSDLERLEARKLGFNSPANFVVPNGIELEDLGSNTYLEAAERLRARAYGPYVLYLGRLNWKKGIDRLIIAMARLPDAILILAGPDDGAQRSLERLAREIDISERVLFTGPTYGVEKAALMANAAAFVLPSTSENFGNAVVEAMGYGTPVIVTPNVGVAEYVHRYGAGLVCDSDPAAITEGLNKILSNKSIALAMGNKGSQLVQDRFKWDAIAGEMEERYRELVDVSVESAGTKAA